MTSGWIMQESTIEFVNRKIRGIDKNFVTPKHDYGCFDMIVNDWGTYAPQWSPFIDNYRTVIQAGGNVGAYPWLLGRKFERVYTFEPDPYSFFCLAQNLKQPKFIKFNCCLGDGCGQQQMIPVAPYAPDQIEHDPLLGQRVVQGRIMHNTGMSKVGYGPMTVHQLSIDSLNIDDVDLIMLDIEGFELHALRGAVNTIKRCSPVILIEATNQVDQIEKLLTSAKYTKVAEFAEPTNQLWKKL